MATLTIRKLEVPLKQQRLRLRAAARNHSMEEEARQILRAALQEPALPTLGLGAPIHARFAGQGDVRLAIEPREPVRAVPELEASAVAEARPDKPRPRASRR